MISNVHNIKKGQDDLGAILSETERVAAYNELERKQALHLRLLAEELVSMLPELLDRFEGKFWIETEDNVYKMAVSLLTDEMNTELRDELIGVSKSGKNAAAVGIMGKIRCAVEGLIMDMSVNDVYYMPMAGIDVIPMQYADMVYSRCWSLNQYRTNAEENKQAEAWDELEKSIIANIADDVIVGVKGNRADIIIIKKFD